MTEAAYEFLREVDISGDGGVIKSVYQEGTGESPPEGDEVRGTCGQRPWLKDSGTQGLISCALCEQLTTPVRCWTAASLTAPATAIPSSR
jgi:hypothetical protein